MTEGQYSEARNKIIHITIENNFKIKKILIETLIGEMKPVVMGATKRMTLKVEKNY